MLSVTDLEHAEDVQTAAEYYTRR